jgi:hypothetical protein
MQVMNTIKSVIYNFYVPHNLTVRFLRHSALQYHYFITQLSAATYCQLTVLTWSTLPSAHWRGEAITGSDEW